MRRSVLRASGPVRLGCHLGEEAFDFAAQIAGPPNLFQAASALGFY